MKTIEEILNQLAVVRWTDIRRTYNRAFSTYGPGADWERWKRDSQLAAHEEKLLSIYLGKEPFDNWLVSVD